MQQQMIFDVIKSNIYNQQKYYMRLCVVLIMMMIQNHCGRCCKIHIVQKRLLWHCWICFLMVMLITKSGYENR